MRRTGAGGGDDRMLAGPWTAVPQACRRSAALVAAQGTRAAALAVAMGLVACSGALDDVGSTVIFGDVCSTSWWRGDGGSVDRAAAPARGFDVNAACDGEGNTPVHLALSRDGIFTEREFSATARVVRAGADLFAVNGAGESAVTLAEDRFQRLLARWDGDLEQLCAGIDVLDEAVQRERWENSLYYLIRTDSGLETLEEVRARTNARRERPPSCGR